MTTLLPLIGLALAIASFLTLEFRPPISSTRSFSTAYVAVLGLLLATMAFSWWKRDAFPGIWPCAWAVGLGLLVASAAHGMETLANKACDFSPVPVALAVAGAAALPWWKATQVPNAQMAAVLGAAAGAWMLFAVDGRKNRSGIAAAAYLGAIVCADALGRIAVDTDAGLRAGTSFGMFAALAAFVGGAQQGLFTGSKLRIGRIVATVAFLAGVWIVGERYLQIRDSWTLVGGAALVGLIVNWLLPSEPQTGESESFRFLLAVVIGVSLATIGFAQRQGFGVSLVAVGVVSTLLVLGNSRAVLSMGPLVALSFYRVFREAHVDASRALDIGQHYALIGIALGAIVVLLPTEWRPNGGPGRVAFASALWAVLLGGVPIAAALFLGPKGAIGLVAGVGFGAVVAGLRGDRSLVSLSVAIGVAAATVLTFGWVGDTMLMAHDEKLAVLKKVVVFLAVLIAAIYLATPRFRDETRAVAEVGAP